MSRHDVKRKRAASGGAASTASPSRYAPLRLVIEEVAGVERLECGHTQRTRYDMVGQTYASGWSPATAAGRWALGVGFWPVSPGPSDPASPGEARAAAITARLAQALEQEE